MSRIHSQPAAVLRAALIAAFITTTASLFPQAASQIFRSS